MRRALILPTVTILLLLGLCIANGLLLRQHTDRWSGMAAETARYARSERWPEAAGNWTLWRQTGTKPRAICISWYTTAP